ncbi:MAG: LysM peptidoglycan-binding domain-containing protein [Candidatus Binatia bacterium]
MSTLRFGVGALTVFAALSLPVAGAYAQSEAGREVAAAGGGVFRYALHPNESLLDVARIFGVPVATLIERNRIADPNRMRTGQVIEIPDAYAVEAAALRSERDVLLGEKRTADGEATAKQQAMSGLVEQISKLEEEKSGLQGELAATAYWEQGAKILALCLLGMIAWALKLVTDRSTLKHRLRSLTVENGALTTAKEKYKDAVGQIELRFQQLYSGRHAATKELVLDGVARIKRAFADGSMEIERLVTSAKLEREKEERLIDAEQRVFGRLSHPLREVLARNRS